MYNNYNPDVITVKDTVLAEKNASSSSRMALMDEIRQLKLDVEARKLMWGMAEPGYEEAAWHAYQAVSERLNALLREAKQGVWA
ncbi:hypothetical protein LLE49_06410 [Alicyclobacillus tolerans]|uniref:hypothetical protein n=1 Tax=Alicyclobacillus tolerans TaxID=90970 RepID=UPI001F45B3BC|nr:hypothetical protein [Alicyclobacillus tolerans]MCF8564377.1 hypothetical protein [Alicyclobacillus tolerans]